MIKTYTGKTKDVYALEDGNILLQFKDTATGTDGVFDPGANTVGLSIEGLGKQSLKMSKYYFEKLEAAGIATQYISCSIADGTMTVRPAKKYGDGLEVICRFRAVGSFLRRYGAYCKEGQALDAFVEMTLKDDAREDPPITKDALSMLGLMNPDEYETIKTQTQRIARFIRDDLARAGAELYDIKFEFGRGEGTGGPLLIDEISGGNMRVYKDGKIVGPMDIGGLLGL